LQANGYARPSRQSFRQFSSPCFSGQSFDAVEFLLQANPGIAVQLRKVELLCQFATKRTSYKIIPVPIEAASGYMPQSGGHARRGLEGLGGGEGLGFRNQGLGIRIDADFARDDFRVRVEYQPPNTNLRSTDVERYTPKFLKNWETQLFQKISWPPMPIGGQSCPVGLCGNVGFSQLFGWLHISSSLCERRFPPPYTNMQSFEPLAKPPKLGLRPPANKRAEERTIILHESWKGAPCTRSSASGTVDFFRNHSSRVE